MEPAVTLFRMGYDCQWRVLNPADFGAPTVPVRPLSVKTLERVERAAIRFGWPDEALGKVQAMLTAAKEREVQS